MSSTLRPSENSTANVSSVVKGRLGSSLSSRGIGVSLLEGPVNADKNPNRPSLNLSNFIKVTLQTGKDSLKGLLCGSQDP